MGVVSLKDLVLADPERLVKDLMFEDFVAVSARADQEEACEFGSEIRSLSSAGTG